MDIHKLFREYWEEFYPENVIYLSTYKLEQYRNNKNMIPIPIEFWKEKRDLRQVREFRIEIQKRKIRKEHNDKVLANFRAEKGKKPS